MLKSLLAAALFVGSALFMPFQSLEEKLYSSSVAIGNEAGIHCSAGVVGYKKPYTYILTAAHCVATEDSPMQSYVWQDSPAQWRVPATLVAVGEAQYNDDGVI